MRGLDPIVSMESHRAQKPLTAHRAQEALRAHVGLFYFRLMELYGHIGP